MYMLTCDQGVVLPFFVNLYVRRKKKSHLIAGYVLLYRRNNFLQTLFLLFKFLTSETIGSFVSKKQMGFCRLTHFKTSAGVSL